MKVAIAGVVESIGGFRKLVAPGDTILLKPNFNTADPPPASSDPLFVKALIEILYDYGAGRVVLGESSMFALSTWDVLAKTGMLEAARQAGAEVVVFDRWVKKEIPGGRYLKSVSLSKVVLEAPKLIYATCLKTHRYAEFTMSLKLAVAFVRPRERLRLHLRRLREKVAELNTVLAPDLIVTDGRKCFITDGPSAGQQREPGLILASGDRIALDVEGVRIIQGYPGNILAGKDPWRLAQIRRSVELGFGVPGPETYEVVEAGDAVPDAGGAGQSAE